MTGGVADDAPREAPAYYDVEGGTTFATVTTEGGGSRGEEEEGGGGTVIRTAATKATEDGVGRGAAGGSAVVRVASMEVERAPPGSARGGRGGGRGCGPIVSRRRGRERRPMRDDGDEGQRGTAAGAIRNNLARRLLDGDGRRGTARAQRR